MIIYIYSIIELIFKYDSIIKHLITTVKVLKFGFAIALTKIPNS